jgi:hypothetical protein
MPSLSILVVAKYDEEVCTNPLVDELVLHRLVVQQSNQVLELCLCFYLCAKILALPEMLSCQTPFNVSSPRSRRGNRMWEMSPKTRKEKRAQPHDGAYSK